jgi:hypothetical protein
MADEETPDSIGDSEPDGMDPYMAKMNPAGEQSFGEPGNNLGRPEIRDVQEQRTLSGHWALVIATNQQGNSGS